MKYIILTLTVLLLTAGSAFGQGSVTPPPDTVWDDCSGCYTYAYWPALGSPAEFQCNYDSSFCSGDSATTQSAFNINMLDGVIDITIGDYYVVTKKKRIFIYLEGTGAADSAILADITGINTQVTDTSIGGESGVFRTFDGNNWSIEIRGLIWPQPDVVQAQILVPGGAAVEITGGWAHTCCNYQSASDISVPSITTWGAAILVALLLISGLYIIRRRKVTA